MNTSRFNVFTECEDGFLLYNCLTNSLLRISEEQYKIFKKYFILSPRCAINDMNSDTSVFIKGLQDGGFIVGDDVDEMEKVKMLHYIQRFQNNDIYVTISPTNDCNFNCSYCYESDKQAVYMTKETEQSILKYIRAYISRTPSLKRLTLNWFGGEATLALDSVYRLSRKIRRLTMQNKIEFSSTFTTNGYYVNRKVAANLKNNGVNCITITIDGPSHIHNKRRCLKSGEGTFDAILKNVLDISDIVKVLISCTVDKENAEYIRELLDILEKKGLAKKVLLALSQTIAFPGTCESTKELCFNTSEFCELLKELYPVIFKRGFNLSKSMPQAYLPNCSAIGMRTIIFDAEGYMYKCTKTLGKKNERIGHVSQVMKQNNSLNNNLNDNLNNNVKWLAWDPFEDKRCLSCRVLPLCMGGCPYISIQREVPEIYGSKCRMWKYMIDDFVKILYNFRKEEKNESIKV